MGYPLVVLDFAEGLRGFHSQTLVVLLIG